MPEAIEQILLMFTADQDSAIGGLYHFVLRLIPFVLFIELPLYLLILLGIIRYKLGRRPAPVTVGYRPLVSCIIACYSEGDDVKVTVRTLLEQLYPGEIEILAVVDGADANPHTLRALRGMEAEARRYPGRRLKILPKYQRGGRVSTLNTGFALSRGEIVMALDGDTSFDNDMVATAASRFADPRVMAVAGTLRVRNAGASLIARLQSLEYLLSIHASRVGLAEFNLVNNISGAFGVFRRSMLEKVRGWDSGTAEDLDLTMRLKSYLGRYRDRRIVFEPLAVGHTDVPATFRGLMQQRMRWDGDLSYIYLRKHRQSFSPRVLGWPNFLVTIWYGLLFQLVMPFIILGYTVWMLFTANPLSFAAAMMVVYVFYLVLTTVFFLVALLALSERPDTDAKLVLILPLFPIYTFILRLWAAVATLAELILRNNQTTTMAPWWVLKRNRF